MGSAFGISTCLTRNWPPISLRVNVILSKRCVTLIIPISSTKQMFVTQLRRGSANTPSPIISHSKEPRTEPCGTPQTGIFSVLQQRWNTIFSPGAMYTMHIGTYSLTMVSILESWRENANITAAQYLLSSTAAWARPPYKIGIGCQKDTLPFLLVCQRYWPNKSVHPMKGRSMVHLVTEGVPAVLASIILGMP